MCIFSTIIDFVCSKEFLHDFIGSFIGLVIGVLWSDWKWKRDRAEQSKLLRSNLVKSFRFNLDRIQQCLDYLHKTPPLIPNFRMDTSTVGHILFTGRDLFRGEALFDRFNWQRYQLEHINAKLDYIHIYLTSSDDNHIELARREFGSLVGHLKISQKEISQMIGDYERVA
jgi:hypothetical protein